MKNVVTIFFFLITVPWQVNAADQEKIDKIIDVIERFCLSGKDFHFSADIGGKMTFKTLDPGAQGKVDVNIKKARGAVGYLKEEIRKMVDEDTRRCMEPRIDRIENLILE